MVNAAWSIAIGLLGISVMILIHELGHFLAALMLGIEVEIVSFGFGPPIFKWGRRFRFQIGALPFGGYCKMKGESDLKKAIARKDRYVNEAEQGSLYAASPWKRLVLYLLGPVSNILFAIICLFFILMLPVMVPASEPRIVLASDYPELFPDSNDSPARAGMRSGQVVQAVDGIEVKTFEQMEGLLRDRRQNESVLILSEGREYAISPAEGIFGLAEFVNPVVASVADDSPEKAAGLQTGDLIVSANGLPTENMFDILMLRRSGADIVDLKILRSGDFLNVVYYPSKNPDGRINVNFTLRVDGRMERTRTFGEALRQAARQTWSIFDSGLKSLYYILMGQNSVHGTIAGTFSASSSIGEMTASGFNRSFNTGLRTALYLLAVVSTSLAVVNLLPLPSLDGGLILLSIIELIKGKNSSPKVYMAFQALGFVLIIAFTLIMNFAK